MLCSGMQGFWIVADLFLQIGLLILIPVPACMKIGRQLESSYQSSQWCRRATCSCTARLSIRVMEFQVDHTPHQSEVDVNPRSASALTVDLRGLHYSSASDNICRWKLVTRMQPFNSDSKCVVAYQQNTETQPDDVQGSLDLTSESNSYTV